MSPTTNNNRNTNEDHILSNSANTKFPCAHCKKLYIKDTLQVHEAKCVSSRTCPWCKIVFRNRGNLASHTKHLHQNIEIRNTRDEKLHCDVCDKVFVNVLYLKYHIRREHYNLKTKITLRDAKTINQVWFERVLNSDVIVEISKREHNRLLIQKYGKDTDDIEVNEDFSDIDLSNIYPLQATRIKCEICNKSIIQKNFKKHFNEEHSKDSKKHHCSHCNKSFSKIYFYVKHQYTSHRNVIY